MNNEQPKKSMSFILPVLLILGLAVYFIFTNNSSEPNVSSLSTPEETAEPVVNEPDVQPVTTAQNEVRVTIEGSIFSFSPNTISAKVGDKVVIEFKNIEGFHDLKIDEFNVGTEKLEAGNSETVEFVADKAGTFEFYCSVGEHRKMGMVGTLTIE